jgi:hypothetical protein
MKIAVAAALASALVAAPLAADDHADPLAVYGAMAKLEANKAEAAGAVLKAAAFHDMPEVLEEAAEDFESDHAQLMAYIALLQGMEISSAQRQAVDAFEAGWTEVAATGATLIAEASGDAAFRTRVVEWWESLDDLDDVIDDALEELLEEKGIVLLEDDDDD